MLKLLTTFDDKHMFMALLTVIAGVAGYFGLHMDPTTIAVLLSPAMIAIGAHGWGAAAATTAATASNTAALQPASSPTTLVVAPVVAAPPRPPQAGLVVPELLTAFVVVLCLAVPVVAGLGSCAGATRQKALAANVATIDTAQSTLVTTVKNSEASIVASATSLADGQAKLAAFRSKVAAAELAIATAYRAAEVAAAASDSGTLDAVTTAAGALAATLASLGGSQ